jgi:hypothetical protein
MQQFFSRSQFISLKLQICHIAAWIFGYLNLFFNMSPFKSMALRHRDVRACVPSRYHSAGLSQPSLYFGNDFLVVLKLLSADCIFQNTEKMVVGRNQIQAVRWMKQDCPLKLCDGFSALWLGFEGPIGHTPLSILTGEWFCRRFPYQ